jgi:WD40 repeat protein/tetratricopeptide (TPR) repeat protein
LKHDSYVCSASFSPDGRRVVTASSDTTVRIWDARTSLQIGRPLAHTSPSLYAPVFYAEYSPDGSRIISASGNRAATLWDVSGEVRMTKALMHSGEVRSAHFSPEGLRIVSTSADTTARLADVVTVQPSTIPLLHSGVVSYARFSPDGQHVATASADKTARIWSVCAGQAPMQLGCYSLGGYWAEFSPDGRWVVTASAFDPASARVWDAHTGAPRTAPMRHQREIKSARFSQDGSLVVTASWDGTARVWNASTGQPVSPPLTNGTVVRFAQFSHNGQWVVTASGNSTARIWDARSGQLLRVLPHGNTVWFAEFSPDDRKVVTASSDQTACIWDAQTGQRLAQPIKHENYVVCARFSPDGESVLTASADNTARIWKASNAEPRTPPLMHEDRVLQAAFSPDGRRVATASQDGAVRIWDAATGRALTEPMKHSYAVNSLDFSPDGQRIATGSNDGTARVWDVRTGMPTTEALRHGGPVRTVRFSPDGQRLVTACSSSGKALQIWEVPNAPVPVPGWLPALAEAIAGQRLHELDRSQPETVSCAAIFALKRELMQGAAAGFYERLGQWSFADRATRTISPFCGMTVPEYVSSRIEDDTLESLREALLLSPTNGLAFARLARHILVQQAADSPQKLAEAEFYCRRAAALAPDHPEVAWARAEFWEHTGQLGKAMETMEQMSHRQPRNPDFWSAWGAMLEKTNRLEEASQAYSRAIELVSPMPDRPHEDQVRLLERRFGVLCRLGQSNAAMLDLDRIVASTPTNTSSELNRLAWNLVTGPAWCRCPAKAVSIAQQAVALEATAYTLDTLGVAYYRLGNWNKAAEALQSALSSPGRQSSSTLFFLAMTYHQLGQSDRAEDYYRQAVTTSKGELGGHAPLDSISAEADSTLGKLQKPRLDNQTPLPTTPASK